MKKPSKKKPATPSPSLVTSPSKQSFADIKKCKTVDELDRLVIHAMHGRKWPTMKYTAPDDSLLIGQKTRNMTFHEAAIYFKVREPGLSQFLESVTDRHIELLEGLTNQVMTNRDAWKRISLKREKKLQDEISKPRLLRKKGTEATKRRAQERKVQFLEMLEMVKRDEPRIDFDSQVNEARKMLKEQGVKVSHGTAYNYLMTTDKESTPKA